jgi:hypothetical protein
MAFTDQKAGYNSANKNYDDLFLGAWEGAVWFQENCKDNCWGNYDRDRAQH